MKDSDTFQEHAMIIAARTSNRTWLEMLIQTGASVNVADEEGHSAVTTAINYSNAECVLLLMQSGANVNVDVLIWAAQKGHPKCVKEAMRKGVDVNCSNSDGNTPLIVAAENGHIDYIKALNRGRSQCEFLQEVRAHGVVLGRGEWSTPMC